jgi:hypothetical protein
MNEYQSKGENFITMTVTNALNRDNVKMPKTCTKLCRKHSETNIHRRFYCGER